MATLASDNFDRADSTNIGSDWTEQKGDWEILSNKLNHKTDSGTSGEDIATWDTALNASPAADYDVEAIVRLTVTGGMGVVVRYLDDNNMYLLFLNTVGQTLEIYKKVSGSYTQLGSTYSAGQSISIDYTLKLSMVGSTIKGYQDGVERISATDSDLTATGKPGVISDSAGKLW